MDFQHTIASELNSSVKLRAEVKKQKKQLFSDEDHNTFVEVRILS
jgi:hypothetical protein